MGNIDVYMAVNEKLNNLIFSQISQNDPFVQPKLVIFREHQQDLTYTLKQYKQHVHIIIFITVYGHRSKVQKPTNIWNFNYTYQYIYTLTEIRKFVKKISKNILKILFFC